MSRLVLVVVVTCLSSCSRPCRRSDVERVLTAYRVEPAGTPSYVACVDARLTPPAAFDRIAPVVEACSAEGAAQLFECLAAHATTCLDGGIDAAVSACSKASSTRLPSASARTEQEVVTCGAECARRLRACAGACPTTSWQACATCDETCARVSRQCDDACR
ncbi:MAG: hypothetical protein Q8S33_26045 [Myxococcales bacterium]|nr:hypothetical protein [Myxococcales bacterium]